MWEKPVWRGVVLGGIVILLLLGVWFISRNRNDAGGSRDSAGRWQVPVPQPDAPEAPRWGSNLAAPSSPGPSADAPPSPTTAGEWDSYGSSPSPGQTAVPPKSPLGFDLPPGNRWGEPVTVAAGPQPSADSLPPQYSQPQTSRAEASLPVPSFPPQGMYALPAQQGAWDAAASQAPVTQPQPPTWANAVPSSVTESQPSNAAVSASLQEGQPCTVQNPYYQPANSIPEASQYAAQNASGTAWPAAQPPVTPAAPTSNWAVQPSQSPWPNLPTSYPQSQQAFANAPGYRYPGSETMPPDGLRVAARDGNNGNLTASSGYVPAYSPDGGRPTTPTWAPNPAAAPTYSSPSGFSPSGAVPGWNQYPAPSLPSSVPNLQPQVVDPGVVRADYTGASQAANAGSNSGTVPNWPATGQGSAATPGTSPYYYPTTPQNAPVYPQTSTSTWNTYR